MGGMFYPLIALLGMVPSVSAKKLMLQESTVSSPGAQTPLVTVVTATFNLIRGGRVDYFRRCVESVHAQTYEHIEHLVVDGASSDGTLALLQEYEQKGWLKVYSEPDKGIYDAFNKGIGRAGGKYIAFLNSDDFWHDPQGVEDSVRMLEESGADFSFAPNRVVNAHGEPVGVRDTPLSCFFACTPLCHQTMFCRTDCLKKIGCFDRRYRIAADYDAIVRMLMEGGQGVRVPLNFTSFRNEGISCEESQQAVYVRETEEVHRRLYFPHIREDEVERLRMGLLPDSLKQVFAQKLHPSVYEELQSRCTWDCSAKAWHYHGGRLSWGPFGIHQLDKLRQVRDFFRRLGRSLGALFRSAQR